tara:strand:+ start:819 stop:968 length:150 start_codon:yes stop_codon:yes gene_type:complete
VFSLKQHPEVENYGLRELRQGEAVVYSKRIYRGIFYLTLVAFSLIPHIK